MSREPGARQLWGTEAGGDRDLQQPRVLARQDERDDVGPGQTLHAVGDVLQDGEPGLRAGQQLTGHGARGLQPLLPAAGLLVQPRVLDGDPRRRGERPDQLHVLVGERPAVGAVGEVEVAVHHLPDPDRHPEEAGHRRMSRGEARRPGVPGDRVEPDRPGVGDDGAEHAPALRQVLDRGHRRLVQAGVHELLQQAVGTEHAEGRVLGAGHGGGRGNDPAQYQRQRQLTHDRLVGRQQLVHPALGRLGGGALDRCRPPGGRHRVGSRGRAAGGGATGGRVRGELRHLSPTVRSRVSTNHRRRSPRAQGRTSRPRGPTVLARERSDGEPGGPDAPHPQRRPDDR